MSLCKNCDNEYADTCPWCEYRREELLERLRPDRGVMELPELAAMAMFGEREIPRRCWEVK